MLNKRIVTTLNGPVDGGAGIICLITLLVRLDAAILPAFTSSTIVLSPGIALRLKLATKTFATRHSECHETDGLYFRQTQKTKLCGSFIILNLARLNVITNSLLSQKKLQKHRNRVVWGVGGGFGQDQARHLESRGVPSKNRA